LTPYLHEDPRQVFTRLVERKIAKEDVLSWVSEFEKTASTFGEDWTKELNRYARSHPADRVKLLDKVQKDLLQFFRGLTRKVELGLGVDLGSGKYSLTRSVETRQILWRALSALDGLGDKVAELQMYFLDGDRERFSSEDRAMNYLEDTTKDTLGDLADFRTDLLEMVEYLKEFAEFQVPPGGTEEAEEEFETSGFHVLVKSYQSSKKVSTRGVTGSARSLQDSVIKTLDLVRTLLSRKGFGNLCYGLLTVETQEMAIVFRSVDRIFSASAVYDTRSDAVTTFLQTGNYSYGLEDRGSAVIPLVHELGHRYYYKFMTPEQRNRWEGWSRELKVPAVSDYGATSATEKFPEVFVWYILGRNLSSDQVEEFKEIVRGTPKREGVESRTRVIHWYPPDLESEAGEYLENEYTRKVLSGYGVILLSEDDVVEYLSHGRMAPFNPEKEPPHNLENMTVDPEDFEQELGDAEYRGSFESMQGELDGEGSISLPAPIILQLPGGKLYGFSGNRRTWLARKNGIPVEAWVVRFQRSPKRESTGLDEAEYQGRTVTLNKPFRTPDGPKKFSVYVLNDKGNAVKVNFGDPDMEIRRDDPQARKNFRSRHNCDNPGPKDKARYWSCYQWREGERVAENVEDVFRGLVEGQENMLYHVVSKKWDGEDLVPGAIQVERGWKTEKRLRSEWEGRYKERYSDRQWDELFNDDAREVHCHVSFHSAREYQNEYAPRGEILEIDPETLDIRKGREYGQPVIRGVVPKEFVHRVLRGGEDD